MGSDTADRATMAVRTHAQIVQVCPISVDRNSTHTSAPNGLTRGKQEVSALSLAP